MAEAEAAAAKRRTEEIEIFMLIDLVVVSGCGLGEVVKLEIVDVDLSAGCHSWLRGRGGSYIEGEPEA